MEGSSSELVPKVSVTIRAMAKTFLESSKRAQATGMILGDKVVFNGDTIFYPKVTIPPDDSLIEIKPVSAGLYVIYLNGKRYCNYRSREEDYEKIKKEEHFKIMLSKWLIPTRLRKVMSFASQEFDIRPFRLPKEDGNECTHVVSYEKIAFFAFKTLESKEFARYSYANCPSAPFVKEFMFRVLVTVEKSPTKGVISEFRRQVRDYVKSLFPNTLQIEDFRLKMTHSKIIVSLDTAGTTVFTLIVMIEGLGNFSLVYTPNWQSEVASKIEELKKTPNVNYKPMPIQKRNDERKRAELAARAASDENPIVAYSKDEQNMLEQKKKGMSKSSEPSAKAAAKGIESINKVVAVYRKEGGVIQMTADSFQRQGAFSQLSEEDRQNISREFGTYVQAVTKQLYVNLTQKGYPNMKLKLVLSFIPTPTEEFAEKHKTASSRPVFAIKVINSQTSDYFYYNADNGEGDGYSAALSNYLAQRPNAVTMANTLTTVVISRFVPKAEKNKGKSTSTKSQTTRSDQKVNRQQQAEQRKKNAQMDKGKGISTKRRQGNQKDRTGANKRNDTV